MIFTNLAQIEYNGYQWDGASHMTIRCEPVYDDAERVVVCHHYTVRVVGVVAGDGGTTDQEMQQIRAQLTKPGRRMAIRGAGFYDLVVNQAGVTDCRFGPKPRVINWTPIGSAQAAEVEWECETWIVFCADALDPTEPIAFNYGVNYALDLRGLTTRTISGYIEIAMNRTDPDAQTIPHTVDEWRERVRQDIPDHFQRTSQNFQISPDKRRLDFSIVDTELPNNNPYPRGVAKVSGHHRVGWTRRGGGAGRLRNNISVEIELAPNQPMLNAYAAFAAIIRTRIDIARAAYRMGVMVEDIQVQEDLFGRDCNFSCSYTVCAPLQRLLADLGLWTPLAHNTWGEWAASIAETTDERGWANMRLQPTQDVLVDPCGSVFTMPWNVVPAPRPIALALPSNVLRNETPPPEESWLEYDAHVYVYRDRALVRQSIMQRPENEDPDFNPQDTGGLVIPPAGGQPDILQRGGKSRYTASLVGHAKRAGHKIPKPALRQVGGADTVEIDAKFFQKITGNWLGVPIYQATWVILYSLASEPGDVPPQANIEQGVQADGTAVQPT